MAASYLFQNAANGTSRNIGTARRTFDALQFKVFTDPVVSGGTTDEVARDIGIEALGLQLIYSSMLSFMRWCSIATHCPGLRR